MDASKTGHWSGKGSISRWRVRLVIMIDGSQPRDVPRLCYFYSLSPHRLGLYMPYLLFIVSRYSTPWQLLRGRCLSRTWNNALSHLFKNIISARVPVSHLLLRARQGLKERALTLRKKPESGLARRKIFKTHGMMIPSEESRSVDMFDIVLHIRTGRRF